MEVLNHVLHLGHVSASVQESAVKVLHLQKWVTYASGWICGDYDFNKWVRSCDTADPNVTQLGRSFLICSSDRSLWIVLGGVKEVNVFADCLIFTETDRNITFTWHSINELSKQDSDASCTNGRIDNKVDFDWCVCRHTNTQLIIIIKSTTPWKQNEK